LSFDQDSFLLDLVPSNSSKLVLGISSNTSEQLSMSSSGFLHSWGFSTRGFRFGSVYDTNSAEVQIDVNESFIKAPEKFVSFIFSELLEGMACRVEDFKFIFCGCELVENSPELLFYVEDLSISISPLNLFEPVGEECRFVVTYHKENQWVLGQALFFEYQMNFEFQTRRIHLSQKPHEKPEEEKPILTHEELWITFFTIGGCFLFYILVRVSYVVYVWASQRFGNRNEDIQEPLVENLDFLEIAKFRARRSENSNR
jgi:hypothetical protein